MKYMMLYTIVKAEDSDATNVITSSDFAIYMKNVPKELSKSQIRAYLQKYFPHYQIVKVDMIYDVRQFVNLCNELIRTSRRKRTMDYKGEQNTFEY